jgi:uncharacterized FAD-dependent dehydrogenase
MKSFDVIIIGAGPSGIFAALKLVEENTSLKIALMDKGGDYYSREKEKSKELTGFGGAAMRYDANLDYSDRIPNTSNLGKRIFGSTSSAIAYISEVYIKLELFGLKKSNKIKALKVKHGVILKDLNIIDRGIVPIGERSSSKILKNIYDYLISKGVFFFQYTEVINIKKNNNIFKLDVRDLKHNHNISFQSSFIIWSTGKLAVKSSINIFEKLGITYSNCHAIDVGVRIETTKHSTEKIIKECANPKIILNEKKETTRTFCWCPGGKVISYDFAGYKILDGQHCHDNPTNQTNFGIVTTIKFPKNINGINAGIEMVKKSNLITNNKVGLQLLRDFIAGTPSSLKSLNKNLVKPTIEFFSLVDLNKIISTKLKKRILKLINKINKYYPKSISEDAIVYAPVLERIFAQPKLDFNMESSVKRFYVIGDISGKAIGIITGAAMGIKAATHIINVYNKK